MVLWGIAGIALFGCLYFLVDEYLRGRVELQGVWLGRLKKECENIEKENDFLLQENDVLSDALKKTVALYEITRNICVSLEEEKIFSVFKDEMNKYIEFEECRFLKSTEEKVDAAAYATIPLDLHRYSGGWLAVKGLRKGDEEKFAILAQQFKMVLRRALLYQRLQDLAITDTLTGVFTRKHFLDRLQEEIDYSRQFAYPFGFLMLDIDHFKEYNDNYGHLVGDALLREVAKVIKENLRQIDLIGRYGGEEFTVILTQTDKEGACFAAERIRQSLENRSVSVYDESFRITLSIGLSMFPDAASELADLIEKADNALYKAKESGRNRVCVYDKTGIG